MAYQDAPSPPMTPALQAACERAIHVITPDGRTLRAGRAVLHVLALLGYPRLAAVLSLPPMLALVEYAYRTVSNNRPFFARFLFTKEEPI